MPVRRPRVGFSYDPRTGRYRNLRTGRLVGAAEIRRVSEIAISKSAQRVQALAGQLRAGSISPTEFEIAMRAEIKIGHLEALALAKGGRHRITQSDYGRVGQKLQQEYLYLERFAVGIATEQIPLDGRFQRRAVSYAQAARATFSETERSEQSARGFDTERNIIRPGENCEGCKAATDAGVVPIGTLTPIGQRDCLNNCRCLIVYSKAS